MKLFWRLAEQQQSQREGHELEARMMDVQTQTLVASLRYRAEI
jgi:hypothetical protein